MVISLYRKKKGLLQTSRNDKTINIDHAHFSSADPSFVVFSQMMTRYIVEYVECENKAMSK